GEGVECLRLIGIGACGEPHIHGKAKATSGRRRGEALKHIGLRPSFPAFTNFYPPGTYSRLRRVLDGGAIICSPCPAPMSEWISQKSACAHAGSASDRPRMQYSR